MTTRTFTGRTSSFYRTTSAEVPDTVNLAIALGRPLLVEGEPGSGKTRLADAIAEELGLDRPVRIVVKSTHQARDLLYRFDPLKRLVDAQIPGHQDRARCVWPYIELGPLGRAIQGGCRCVVLIDEIDKADFDFPNDLLEVLDDFRFSIDDLPADEAEACLEKNKFGSVVTGNTDPAQRPIVVITSNREKPLPDAFLRRCLYLRVEFPKDAETLRDIVALNLRDLAALDEAIIGRAVERFLRIRELAESLDVRRVPSTSELVDWVRILHVSGQPVSALSDETPPLHWKTLFKTHSDILAVLSGLPS